MTPVVADRSGWRVDHGDALLLLSRLADASIDAVICDPPYGIDFKNHRWDGQAIRQTAKDQDRQPLTRGQAYECWTTIWAGELVRVLKPGGHLLALAAPRMAHRLTSGLEDAGLEIRDVLLWMYGPGFPKSRRVIEGQATTLKPFYEPIILARRSPIGTVSDAHAEHGTGTLNIDDCAITDPDNEEDVRRWPTPILLSHSADCRPGRCAPQCPAALLEAQRPGASRFLYCTKASRRERDAGCEHLPTIRMDHFPVRGQPGSAPLHNAHPTVKPVELMRWLVRLITPPEGIVLDPFCGSGTTGIASVLEDRRFLGVEREADYVELARSRISHWEANRATLADDPGALGRRPTVAGRGRPAP
jgi:DNA modification methylase